MSLSNIGVNALLVTVSFLVAAATVEAFLRVFNPKYQYAAESQYDPDSLRIWSRRPNVRAIRVHPDTGLSHAVIYNNLAMRQHRDHNESDFNSAINVGFFGDSFTENLRIAAQYSFTEPIDYLLNLSRRRFNVLNFGVDGYGTDQCFLYYRSSESAKRLNIVFYVMSKNDLRNIYENNLFSLSENGALVRNSVPEASPWLKILSRLHATYLILDLRLKLLAPEKISFREALESRFRNRELSIQHRARAHSKRADAIESDFVAGEGSRDLDRSITIFRLILGEWRRNAESNGADFYVVLLPRPEETLLSGIVGDGIAVIDLYGRFQDAIEDYKYEDIRFTEDGHWNEAGNLLAAVSLYRFLEQRIGLPAMSDQQLRRQLYTYYSSFPAGWMPPGDWVTKTDISPGRLSSIQSKYLALELK